MESRFKRHSIREFVHSLDAGTRVIWIANGAMGTVQPDKTIMWDDGHHMTHKHMNDSHALLIHSEAEKALLQEALANRLGCLKRGCSLVSWDASGCKKDVSEKLCPLAVISESETPSVIRRSRRRMKSAAVTAA